MWDFEIVRQQKVFGSVCGLIATWDTYVIEVFCTPFETFCQFAELWLVCWQIYCWSNFCYYRMTPTINEKLKNQNSVLDTYGIFTKLKTFFGNETYRGHSLRQHRWSYILWSNDSFDQWENQKSVLFWWLFDEAEQVPFQMKHIKVIVGEGIVEVTSVAEWLLWSMIILFFYLE